MIEVTELSKRYGATLAVDELSFTVLPGRVTGFLGPNGAGKSTTMRMVLGLDSPTGGRATVNGRLYARLAAPLRELGALLDAHALHDGRSASNHLWALARSNGLPKRRVDEVLAMVGLADVAGARIRGFSLGMRQRLGVAAALLGDPGVLMLDEPMNGLDTEGIRWLRDLLSRLAAEGRTVFLSSHLMSEMELVGDHLVVIGRGRLIADTTMAAFIEQNSRPVTLVRASQAGELRAALEAGGALVEPDPQGGWLVSGPDAATIGAIAHHHGVVLQELSPRRSSLEDIYTELARSSVEYRASSPAVSSTSNSELEEVRR